MPAGEIMSPTVNDCILKIITPDFDFNNTQKRYTYKDLLIIKMIPSVHNAQSGRVHCRSLWNVLASRL